MSIIEGSISDQKVAMLSSGDHDDGLAHCHDWARDCVAAEGSHPVVADAGSVRTPGVPRVASVAT